MSYWNDGSGGVVWEPLYRLRVHLTPCERDVLRNPALRRLQRISHYGAAARVLPMAHTRYEHTLGVFALAAHLRPGDRPLRLAALLHDVGHLPFSHSAERALGADHHRLTALVMERCGLDNLLREHGHDPGRVRSLIEGKPPNPLVCGPDGMSLDHLDSWLRDTQSLGAGETPAYVIAARLQLNGPFLEAPDAETALEIVRRVETDHRLMCEPRCLGLDALVTEIFARAHPEVEALLDLGDEEALLLAAGAESGGPGRGSHPGAGLVEILRERPWQVQVRPDDGGEGARSAVSKLYTGQIWLQGRPVAEVLPEAARVYAGLQDLKRSYRVTWG